jgi:pyruvate dehydrogenase (quinone)
MTGELAVCAASCGPGNLHLINGLFDAAGSRVPVLAIASHIPRQEIGGSYFQETHPQELFRECSVYSELVSVPEQMPRVLEIAMRFAIERSGVAVVVIPGEIFLHDAGDSTRPGVIRPTKSVVRPSDDELVAAAEVLNAAERVTILAGAGCQGAHDEVVALAEALKAPVVHALRGKEFVEYDNPYDVGMTGLLGFASGYRAMEHCHRTRERLDALASSHRDQGPIHPQLIATVLNSVAADDAVFTADVGTPTLWAARYLRMNGRRRLLGSFNHGTMADALPLAIGVQASDPGRQVVSLSGDGGLAMLMGELLTLRQQHLPVKVVVLNNGALAFVELEMKADGIVNFGTDVNNPSFAEIARAVGLHGVRIERPSELEDGLRESLAYDGAAVIEVMTVRQELSIPPKISYDQARGFTLWATRSILSGRGDEVLQVAKSNLRELAHE